MSANTVKARPVAVSELINAVAKPTAVAAFASKVRDGSALWTKYSKTAAGDAKLHLIDDFKLAREEMPAFAASVRHRVHFEARGQSHTLATLAKFLPETVAGQVQSTLAHHPGEVLGGLFHWLENQTPPAQITARAQALLKDLKLDAHCTPQQVQDLETAISTAAQQVTKQVEVIWEKAIHADTPRRKQVQLLNGLMQALADDADTLLDDLHYLKTGDSRARF